MSVCVCVVCVCIHIDPNAVGTDRERKMLQPLSDSYYSSLADSCCASQVYTNMYRYTPICTDMSDSYYSLAGSCCASPR